jgi:hypothetical protein
MVDTHTRATEQILAHVDRARDMILDFHYNSGTPGSPPKSPRLRAAVMKAARQELMNAIKLLQHTPWGRQSATRPPSASLSAKR